MPPWRLFLPRQNCLCVAVSTDRFERQNVANCLQHPAFVGQTIPFQGREFNRFKALARAGPMYDLGFAGTVGGRLREEV